VHEIEITRISSDEFADAMRTASASAIRLDSTGPVSEWSRWSYIADSPRLLLRCDSSTKVATLSDASGVMQRWDDPLNALQWLESMCKNDPQDGPRLKGGWIGWISYDFGRIFETIPTIARDDLGLPWFEFQYHDRVWALDRLNGQCYRVSRRRSVSHPIKLPAPVLPGVQASVCMSSNISPSQYERAVKRALDYIRAGDIFQVNLSQRFTAPLRESPAQIYARLQNQSGSSYGAYFPSSDYALLSNSPELFLRVIVDPPSRKRRIITRPIKGTRPRAPGMEAELRDSTKDQAELNMIVDLERNDLGRVCDIGSVRVTHPRDIEAHPTVYHGVATIEGTLRADVTFVDLLRATFPGGSVTGAPKIRAMQIIDQLEPTRRGPYCGAIGFVSTDGHIEFNLAIRTMIATRGQIHIPVGGGIVADSVPADEYEETLVKARAMFAAIGLDTIR